MTVRNVVAGSILAAGVSAALFGAGTASAAPGISFDPGTGGKSTIGIGDQSEDGAYANATKGNVALAINLSRKNATSATAGGEGNRVIAINGAASVVGTNNNVVTLGGKTDVKSDSNHNTIVNLRSTVTSDKQGDADGARSFSLCGTTFGGQADHITVSPGSTCGGGDE